MDEPGRKHPEAAEDRSFEEISRLARERDYQELEARRQRMREVEERAREEVRNYRTRLREIEAQAGMPAEDVELLHRVRNIYEIGSSSYRSVAAVRDPKHLLYTFAQEIRSSAEPEDVKLRRCHERLFQIAQADDPYLEKFTLDDVLRVARINLPRRPNQMDLPGELDQLLQVAYHDELRLPFARARDTLEEAVDQLADQLAKDQLPGHSERAKALLAEFIQQSEDCRTIQNGTSISRSSQKGLQELTAPDEATGMSPADRMLDLYLEYLMELHQVGDDPSRLQPAKQEQKILKAIQTFNSAATMLLDRIDGLLNGALTVPPEGAAKENGKRIHRIDARGQDPKLTKEYYSKKKADASRNIGFEPKEDEPLFGEKSPSPEDIKQGGLGDCYLLAGLTALAGQDPQKIRDAMHDNQDGTVTVRFFSEANEPVYVTVDKSVPKENGSDLYARKALWVQLMEKAYVQSGLHVSAMEKAEADSEARKTLRQAEKALADAQESARLAAAAEQAEPDELQNVLRARDAQAALRKAEQNRQDAEKAAKAAAWRGKYGSVEGGFMPDFICRMLGSDGSFKGDYSDHVHLFSHNHGPYTRREQAFIQELQESLADGQFVTTATPMFYLPLIDNEKISGKALKRAGLPSNHAYAIAGVEQEDGKYYILVRNPHGGKGVNSHADGVRMMDEQYAAGYSRLELRDFSRLFSTVFTNHYDMTRARMETLAETKTIVRAYGESVRMIAEALEHSDSTMLYFQNSDRFTSFKEAAVALNRMMQSPAPSLGKLNKGLDDFFAAAEAYSSYCENDKKLNLFKDRQRAFVRYEAAKIAMEMKPVVLANRARTLNDKWDEFSYSAAKNKVHVPTAPADALEFCRATADRVAANLSLKSGSFKELKNREKFYRYLRGFVAEKAGKKLAEKASPELDDGQRFDFIQKNVQTVSIQYLLNGHADELVEAMRRDGYLERHPDLAPRLFSRENDRIPFADAPAYAAQSAAAPQVQPPQRHRS